jgi:hypothetical protein
MTADTAMIPAHEFAAGVRALIAELAPGDEIKFLIPLPASGGRGIAGNVALLANRRFAVGIPGHPRCLRLLDSVDEAAAELDRLLVPGYAGDLDVVPVPHASA